VKKLAEAAIGTDGATVPDEDSAEEEEAQGEEGGIEEVSPL
jgi:hypothetical protein